MTHDEAVAFFSALFRGAHHIPGSRYKGANVKPYGVGWCVLTHQDLSTYDFDVLTRLVFLAHDRAVRVEVSAAMRYVRIAIWQRRREGDIGHRHPTIEQALESWRQTEAGDIAGVRP